jgi:hypothetical protein
MVSRRITLLEVMKKYMKVTSLYLQAVGDWSEEKAMLAS